METYEILEKALAEVQKGWCRREREDEKGNVCAIGALQRAVTGQTSIISLGGGTFSEVAYHLDVPFGLRALVVARGCEDLAHFNDFHSHAEVCDLFKLAIAKAKADAGIYLEVPAEERVEA